MEEENEITIKILLNKSVPVNQEFYLDIINGLNDRYVPCNEISLNGEIVYTNSQGFVANRKEKENLQ